MVECYLLQDTWFSDPNCFTAFTDGIILNTWDTNETYFNKIKDPRILAACATSSKLNEDNPLFDSATRGPFQAQFWKAMYDEFITLVHEFDCWDYVPRTPTMKVLPSTWAFKIKRYPDGRVKKFKAQFCASGDRQTEGVVYFKTWAPVVQWSTVQIVMILAIKLNLISIQSDITAAFIHGCVPPTETIYVHQPRGFNCGNGDEVLQLKQTLYGLKSWIFFII